MSAVVGVFNRRGEGVRESTLRAMQAAAIHRAVDGDECWVGGRVGLGRQHFDPCVPHPDHEGVVADDDNRQVVVCDARIDNRDAIASELRLPPRVHADSEIVAETYQRWGTACVDHLNGDFSFIIWDGLRQVMFCARDALGVRDLSYRLDDEVFVVASEIGQILAHPRTPPPTVNEDRLADFFADRWHDHHATFLEGIFHCPPAHCLLVTADSFRCWRYWQPDLGGHERCARTEAWHAEMFRHLLQQAVGNRAGRPEATAISLSGGPDSAVLAGLLNRRTETATTRSYSYVFDRFPSCDERCFIDPVVQSNGLAATLINGDVLEPLGNLASWPVFATFPSQDPYVRMPVAVTEAARRDGCRVVLNGHFSDVLFAGGRYWAADRLAGRHGLRVLATAALEVASIDWRGDVLARGLWLRLPQHLQSRITAVRRGGRPTPPIAPMLEPRFAARTGVEERLRSGARDLGGVSPAIAARYRHLTMSITPEGASAVRELHHALGVEVVDPFWDRELVEFALATPALFLGHPRFSKWLLRKSMTGVAPDHVLWRKDKTSLYELFEYSLTDKNRHHLVVLFDEPQIVQRGFVRRDWLKDELLAGTGWSDFGYPLWRCVTAELWLRRLSNENIST